MNINTRVCAESGWSSFEKSEEERGETQGPARVGSPETVPSSPRVSNAFFIADSVTDVSMFPLLPYPAPQVFTAPPLPVSMGCYAYEFLGLSLLVSLSPHRGMQA